MRAAVRSLLRSIFVQALYWSGATQWAKRRLMRRHSVIVLMFHRVLTAAEQEKSNCLAGIVVRDSTFAGIMQYLRRHCDLLDLSAGMPDWQARHSKLRCAVTFDDGWIDNAGAAFQIAEQFGIPFTIFVCPALIGVKNPFWAEHAIALLRRAEQLHGKQDLGQTVIGGRWKQLSGGLEERVETVVEYLKTLPPAERTRVVAEFERDLEHTGTPVETVDETMGWHDVHRLRRGGVTFGLHTQTHQILTHLSDAQVYEELATSKRDLEEAMGCDCGLFAYPNGSWSEGVRRQVEAAGYTAAFTTYPAPWTADSDHLLIPRINIWEGSATGATGRFSRAALEYTLFWKPWRQMQQPAAIPAPASPKTISEAVWQ
jgi:peptidoglycan/xylan/chitin deacetylase (PgdA/CDA1 family)